MKRIALSCLLLLSAPAALAASYGAALPAGESTALSAALQGFDPAAAAEPRLLHGRIVEVCQAKGCWAVLEDEGVSARLMMRGHAFSIPKDYRGPARVHGSLQRTELSDEAAAHLAADAGKPVPAERVEYRIDTLGIELQ